MNEFVADEADLYRRRCDISFRPVYFIASRPCHFTVVNKPNFRRPRSKHGGPRRDWHGPRKRRREAPFAVQVATFAAAVGLFTYFAIPRAQAAWTIATRTPEETHMVARSVYYRNCDAARAAGVAPIYAGEPGYREGMDGDSDGIACEPYP